MGDEERVGGAEVCEGRGVGDRARAVTGDAAGG